MKIEEIEKKIKMKERVFGMRIVATDHFLQRLEERGINPREIYKILLNEYDRVKLYRSINKLAMYQSDRLSFIFYISRKSIILITAVPDRLSDREGVFRI